MSKFNNSVAPPAASAPALAPAPTAPKTWAGLAAANPSKWGLKKHPTFFIEAEMVTIQAENTLFNVHKQQLQRSETFRDMFDMGEQNNLKAEGSSFENPIKLDGISASDFESFLMALYSHECPGCGDRPFMEKTRFTGADRIIPALRLADMWNFAHHRDYLLDVAFATLGLIDQIVLAQQYNVRKQLEELYVQLCQHNDPLTLEEAKKIGLEGAITVGRVRERLCRRVLAAPVSTRFHPRPMPGWGAIPAEPAKNSDRLNPLPSGEANEKFIRREIGEWFNGQQFQPKTKNPWRVLGGIPLD
ncbi:hypothetical protein FRC09_019033 [Ceratobasidium sp. 395]|nr:hypothetical protein FRC09_019033 [Ceratobasidium sp. 395]